MNTVRKHAALIVAVLGLAAILFGPEYFGLVDDTEAFVQMGLAVLTALGVGIGERIEYDRETDDL